MENPILIVVMKADLPAADMVEAIKAIRKLPGVEVVKTLENIVDAAFPEVAE